MASGPFSETHPLAESCLFWIDSAGKVLPLDGNARKLKADLAERKNLLNALFGVQRFKTFAQTVGQEGCLPVEVQLRGGVQKLLSWQCARLHRGYVCSVTDPEQTVQKLERLSRKDRLYRETLLNILPSYIAEELVENKAVHPKVYRHTTILFTDVASFSRLAFHLDPVTLIRKLNSYVTLHDRIMDEFGIEKIKTIGDSYMCVSGIPGKKASHAVDCCLAALNLLHVMRDTRQEPRKVENVDLNNWSIRIGIHTGPCISGVIGYKKYTFDIWGDSVNIASRMEKSGEAGRINISESTYKAVQKFFHCTYRGSQEVKNIGTVQMYFLNRIHPHLSKDADGFFPNEQFNKRYCDKFSVKRAAAAFSTLPHFIQNYVLRQSSETGGEK